MCDATKIVFGDIDDHQKKGGMKTMGESMSRGHVLVMSLWDDAASRMLWLDSDYPLDRDPSEPGVSRGSCSRDSGDPDEVEQTHARATVKYFNIKYGPLGSTFPGDAPTHAPHDTTTSGPDNTTPGGDTTTSQHGNCPGGSLSACIAICPAEPADIFQGCVQQCMADCN